MASTIGRAVLVATLLGASLLITPSATLAHACSSGREALFFEHEYEDGETFHWCYGDNYSRLSPYWWNDRIDSFRSYAPVGIGFILYKDDYYGGSSWKVCGPTIRDVMPSGWHDAVSSIKSTNLCPQ